MIYQDEIPTRVRLLVLGGGIHGAGILHDMASRGWRDIHLVEKSVIGAGTSSRSTKLIHGGLRYLKHLRDFGLVTEGLRERHNLLALAPDLVHPIELLFPILKKGGMPRLMVKTGLTLYDRLAGRFALDRHRFVTMEQARAKAPGLALEKFSSIYAFFDAQTDDLSLTQRIAASAKKLGAGLTEGCRAQRITPTEDGWNVELELHDGRRKVVSALYIVNALGPWANMLLENSQIKPTHHAVNNKGVHLLFKDMGLKSGLFLQSPNDQRIFFVLPWLGHTLVGTTEELYTGHPDDLTVRADEVEYLLQRCNRYLLAPLRASDIVTSFAGLRWLPMEGGSNITETSRAYVIGERTAKRGLLVTLYGGKLTTYRNLAKTMGDRITTHFGEFRPSQTHNQATWVSAAEIKNSDRLQASVSDRFSNHVQQRIRAV